MCIDLTDFHDVTSLICCNAVMLQRTRLQLLPPKLVFEAEGKEDDEDTLQMKTIANESSVL